MNKKKISIIEILVLLFSLAGLFVLLWSLLIFRTQLNSIDSNAKFGDYIGGIVGTLWAFSGILLFYRALKLQKEEFALQRNEFKLQRIEFILTRITNIIYSQKNIIATAVNNKKLKYHNHIGRSAIDFMIFEIEKFKGEIEYENLTDEKKKKVDFGRESVFKKEFEELIYIIYSSLKLIKEYIEDEYIIEEDGTSHSLTNKNKELLYRLVSSTLNFNDLNKILFTFKSYVFFWEQGKIFGPPIYDQLSRINMMLNYSLEHLDDVKSNKLKEANSFFRSIASVNKDHTVVRKLYDNG